MGVVGGVGSSNFGMGGVGGVSQKNEVWQQNGMGLNVLLSNHTL